MLTIEKSECGKFVRVVIDGRKVAVVPIGEFSRMLAVPGSFVHAPNRTYL